MAEKENDIYVVRKHDTLSGIAKELGIKSQDPAVEPWRILGRLNNINTLEKAKLIRPGQPLILPEGIKTQPAQTEEQTAKHTETPTPKQPVTEVQPAPEQPTEEARPTTKEATEAPVEQPATPETPSDTNKLPPSREEYISIIKDKLAQETPLNKQDIWDLQTALKETGHNPGRIDGYEGKNTYAGIKDFIKTDEGKEAIPKLGAPALGIVEKYEKDPDFRRSIIQESMPATHLATLQNIVERYLEDGTPPSGNKTDMLISLDEMGYNIKDPDVYNEKEVTHALNDYLHDNPEAMKTTSIAHYPSLVKYGHADTLKEILKDPEVLEARRKLVIGTIPFAAEATSVSPGLMKSTWGIESSYGKDIVSGTKCEGDWHFTDGTWNSIMSQNGEEIANLIKQNHSGEEYERIAEEIIAKKDIPGALAKYQYHPVVSTYGAAFLMKSNARSLNVDPSERQNWKPIYSAYNISPSDAKTLLSMARHDDPRSAQQVIGKNARNNPPYFGGDVTAKVALGRIDKQLETHHNEYHERFGRLEREIVQARLPATHLAGLKECVERYIENDRALSGDNTDLLVSLNEMRYSSIEDLNRYDEREVSNALMDYISENPKIILTASTTCLKNLIDHGHGKQLRDIAQKVDNFDNRIAQQLDDMGDFKTAPKTEVLTLQTLLDIDGHRPNGIDGYVGSGTIGAVYRFKLSHNIISLPPFAITASFNDATKAVGHEHDCTLEECINSDHTNGFGVSNTVIERAIADTKSTITGIKSDDIPEKGTTPEDSAADNPRPVAFIGASHGAKNGNGEIDEGKRVKDEDGNIITELTIVDPLCVALAKDLHHLGYQVIFMRNPGEQFRIEGDKNDKLNARPLIAHKCSEDMEANGKLYISIHANSYEEDKSVSGTRIFAQEDGKGGYLNNKSLMLAQSVGNNFSISDKETTIHPADYSVLRGSENGVKNDDNQLNAAILVETAFLTNKGDREKLKEIAKNPQQAASDIANGIHEFVMANSPEVRIADAQRIAEEEAIKVASVNRAEFSGEDNGTLAYATNPLAPPTSTF